MFLDFFKNPYILTQSEKYADPDVLKNPKIVKKGQKRVFVGIYQEKRIFDTFLAPQRSEFCPKMAHFQPKYGIFDQWPVFAI